MTLTPTQIEVVAGNKTTLKCETGDCIPSANITWKISSNVLTGDLENTTNDTTGLVKTTSFLQFEFTKADNGKEVFCTAQNIQGKSVDSRRHPVTVFCKLLILIHLLFKHLKRNFENEMLKAIGHLNYLSNQISIKRSQLTVFDVRSVKTVMFLSSPSVRQSKVFL